MFHFIESLLPRGEDGERERGQIVVLLALAMVGLLVAGGLATDAGVLFMRKSQLDRAVDAAALAGVTQLPTETDVALALAASNTRGQQLLAANGIITTTAAECLEPGHPNYANRWNLYDYCGKRTPGDMPGSIRYHVEVRWQAETYFMKLVGFDTFPLVAEATAEYMPMVDIFSSSAMETSILQSSNQAIFGPQSCSSMGDAYSPVASPWHGETGGVYTYRIRIPADYLTRHDKLRVELFDPDTANWRQSSYVTYNLNGVRQTLSSDGTTCSGNDQREPCLFNKGTAANPFWWFVRIDENRTSRTSGDTGCGTPGSYTPNYNTRTEFRLYYLRQNPDGSLSEVDLAYYIGESDGTNAAEALATDMHWVSPGAPAEERMPAFTVGDVFGNPTRPDASTIMSYAEPATTTQPCPSCSGDGNFIIDLLNETPGIFVDPSTGSRDIFLDVKAISGASENGFELWAGPPRSSDPYKYSAPSYVNARQIYLQLKRNADEEIHTSDGVGIYGIGHLPMNSNTTNRVDIPLAYLGPEFGGQRIYIDLFDADSGTQPPISFYFDTLSRSDWTACFDDGTASNNDCGKALPDGPGGKREHYRGPDNLNRNGQWARYEFIIPGELVEGDVSDGRMPFYGGRLIASYVGGNHDTYGWKMTIESRPFLVK